MERKANLKPPPTDQYTIQHQEIPVKDLELIKITAQFVARNGQKFLAELNQKESSNPNFAFLKPTNRYFGYFTSLLDSYSKVLLPKKDLISRLQSLSTLEGIRKSVLPRYEYEHFKILDDKQKRKEKEEGKEVEVEEYEIDWEDFVVVDVIEIDEEDEEQKPEYIAEVTLDMLGMQDVGDKYEEHESELK